MARVQGFGMMASLGCDLDMLQFWMHRPMTKVLKDIGGLPFV